MDADTRDVTARLAKPGYTLHVTAYSAFLRSPTGRSLDWLFNDREVLAYAVSGAVVRRFCVIDIPAARAKLQRRIDAKHGRIKSAAAPEESEAEQCGHEWRRFRETIRPDNPKFVGEAHFVVVGCTNCRKKRRVAIHVSI